MSRISFIATTDSSWSVTDGALRIGIEIDEADGGKRAETVYFTVPDNFQAHPDLVCVALATLAGRKYPTVAFDFAASPRVQKAIATAYGVSLEFRGAAPPPRQAGDGAVLNFSGGFDSMTALALAEGQPLRLLSMDYGGYFEREETYFRTFDTVICRTDLRQKGFHNDWRFMATGSLLLADMLDAGIAGFGAVLEASAWNFRPDYGYQRPGDFLLRAVGLEQSSWVRGLTEFGTAMAMLALKPDTIIPR